MEWNQPLKISQRVLEIVLMNGYSFNQLKFFVVIFTPFWLIPHMKNRLVPVKPIGTVTVKFILSDFLVDIGINRTNKRIEIGFQSKHLTFTANIFNRVSSSRVKFVYFGLKLFELTPLRDPFHALKKILFDWQTRLRQCGFVRPNKDEVVVKALLVCLNPKLS